MCEILILPMMLLAAILPPMPADFRADEKSVLTTAANLNEKDYPNADVVVLDDRLHTRYEADGADIMWDDEWVKILTEKGRRQYDSLVLNYNTRYGDGAIQCVEIVGTNGVVRRVDFAATLREATDNESLSSNITDPMSRKLSCAVPSLAVGEVRHVIFCRRQLKPRMKGAWADRTMLEYTAPILSTVVSVDAPKALPLVQAVVRRPCGDTLTTHPDLPLGNGRILKRWSVKNVPQMFPEPNMPSPMTQVQTLSLSTVRDWQEVSRWYWHLCEPHLNANAAISNFVAACRKKAPSREALIQALFRFVSQEVRYMGLTLEDTAPGYEPHDVALTFANRYGVCRDKAALLVCLLRVAGIEAYPVLIHAGAKLDAQVPTFTFNHAIVAIAAEGAKGDARDYMLLDPTDESTRDMFPSYLSNRSYLVARAEGETLLLSPVIAAQQNCITVTNKGSLTKGNALLITGQMAFGGINDTAFRGALLNRTADERFQLFERILKKDISGVELLSLTWQPADAHDTSTPLSANYVVRVKEALLHGETRDILTVPFLTQSFNIARGILDENTALERRRFDLELPTTAAVEESLELNLDEKCGAPKNIPPDVTCTAQKGFSFARSFTITNGMLLAKRSFGVKEVDFDPEAYDSLRDTLKDVETAERAEITFLPPEKGKAHVRQLLNKTVVHFTSPHEWVSTNHLIREVLDDAGRRMVAEMRLSYAPCTRVVEVAAASVSNRNGKVSVVGPHECNVMDAAWVAAAPRYPASKMLVVNMPAVGIGSVVDTTIVRAVTNAPVAWTGFYNFDSVERADRIEVELHVPAAMPFKVFEHEAASLRLLSQAEDRQHGTNVWRWVATAPKRIPDECAQPPASYWRKTIFATTVDWQEYGAALEGAFEKSREENAECVKDIAAKVTSACTSPEERIIAIRRFLAEHIRVVGPSLFELPFAVALTPSERILKEGYASPLDRVNLFWKLLEAAGFSVSLVWSADDALSVQDVTRNYITYPRPDRFSTPVLKATYGWDVPLLSTAKTFWLSTENEYTPPGAFLCAGDTYVEVNGKCVAKSAQQIPEGDFTPRLERLRHLTVRCDGAVDFDITNRIWGAAVGPFRKRYTEMRPEYLSRHFQQLVGDLAQNAIATRELKTDLASYPAALSFSAYVSEYAFVAGGTISVRMPGLDAPLFPEPDLIRVSPIALSGTTEKVDHYEIVFPAGFTQIEHLPENYVFANPLDARERWVTFESTFSREGNVTIVHLKRTIHARKAVILPPACGALLREWNRRATSLANRMVEVRR